MAISPGVHLGILTAFERKGLMQDVEQVENRRCLGPSLSTKSCIHNLPRSCVEGCVVLLSEAWGCVDEG